MSQYHFYKGFISSLILFDMCVQSTLINVSAQCISAARARCFLTLIYHSSWWIRSGQHHHQRRGNIHIWLDSWTFELPVPLCSLQLGQGSLNIKKKTECVSFFLSEWDISRCNSNNNHVSLWRQQWGADVWFLSHEQIGAEPNHLPPHTPTPHFP